MSRSLINAYQSNSNQITHIFTENGKVHKEVVNFKPFLGYYSSEKTSWTDMHNKPVKVKVFDSIQDMNSWKKENRDLFSILGDVTPPVQFMAMNYRDKIVLNKTGMKIANLDIEVFVTGGGFPEAHLAAHPINAITINEMVSDTYTTFAYHPTAKYIPDGTTNYIECKNEADLIDKFLDYWQELDPQIITGWNIDTFDIPYLVNRIKQIAGDAAVKKLSIDRKITKHNTTDTTGNEVVTYKLQGHIIWDYMNLYKKFAQEKLEMYTLDFVAATVLDKTKVEYHSMYDTLNELYLKDFQKFIQYNIKDTSLIKGIDDVLNYINVAISIMQEAKCQPDDIFATVKPWDCIIYNDLLSRKKLCPPNTNHDRIDFVGGFVEEPIPGLYEDTEVVDIVSSYPNNLISLNMSPETIIPDTQLPQELLDIRMKYGSIDKCINIDDLAEIAPILRAYNVSFSSNGQFFNITEEGILPSIFARLFENRRQYKKAMKKFESEGNHAEANIADIYQYTLKILLNSGYGALANNFSRYFDVRIAEAITSNGQVCVRGATQAVIKRFPILSCIYNDTDSIFISCKRMTDQRFYGKNPTKQERLNFILKFHEQCLAPELDNFFKKMKTNMNMRVLTLAMEPECVADVTLFVAKKRYIMNNIWVEGKYYLDKPKRKIRGVEIVRSSTPKIVRERLKQAVDIIFTTKSNEDLIEFVEKFKQEFKTLPVEAIAFPRSVSIGDYTLSSKGLPIGVNAALTYNRYLRANKLDRKFQEIADGDKIKFTYIKTPNKYGSHVVGFVNKLPQELIGTFDIDYDTQFTKSFLAPLENIVNVIGWNVEYKESLEDFFS